VSHSRIQDIEAGGNTTVDTLRKLAAALETTVSDLLGESVGEAEAVYGTLKQLMANMEQRGAGKPIPVISWASAGDGLAYTDQGYAAGAADEWIERPPNVHDRKAYAVRVVGDSMSPIIQAGDIVVLVHDQEPVAHDLVLVKLRTGEVYLKLLATHDGQYILVSANQLYPPTVVSPDDLMFPPRKVAAILKR
jgi:repressor LexA